MGEKFFELNIAHVSNKDFREGNIAGFNVKTVLDNSIASSDSNIAGSHAKSETFRQRWTWHFSFGLGLLVSYLCWNSQILTWAVSQQLMLKEGTKMFENWKKDPVTSTLNVYMFNYTNIERFNLGLDPKLKIDQLGPYSYGLLYERTELEHYENATISYRDKKIHIFKPEATNGSLSDVITMPNIPYMSAMEKIKDSNYFGQKIAKATLESLGSNPFTTVTVEEILWGYDDILFKVGSTAMNYRDKVVIPFKKFGLLAGKNGTHHDRLTIFTGEDDISKLGIANRINGKDSLGHWPTTECDRIDAATGPLLRPFLYEDKSIYLYTKEMCRRIKLDFQYELEVNGVSTKHFEPAADFMSNAGEGKCYCADKCLPAGVQNISACSFGAPLLASFPHFYKGDPVLYELLDGIKPIADLHNSYLNIEPNLGFIMNASSAMQLNVGLRNLKWATPLSSKFPEFMILPIVWVKLNSDTYPDYLIWEIKSALLLYKVSYVILFYVPLIVTALCFFMILYKEYRNSRYSKTPQVLAGRIVKKFDEQL